MPGNQDIAVFLSDIQRSICEISDFVPAGMDFYAFQKDLKTRKAVERNIGIIGEAMARILKINPQLPIEEARKIVDTRNRIIHGYDTVSEEVLWAIITKDLPGLQRHVENFLEQNPPL